MLRTYLPALVFLALGGGLGCVFALLNARLGPKRRPRPARADPYECGMPSEFRHGMRFAISFYLVAMLFLIFDIEVLLLFPVSVVLRDFGTHGLLAMLFFLLPLVVAFVYEWRRGALEWRAR